MGSVNTAGVPPHVSVADALLTRVQQRVLAVLFGNPARSFYAKEIIRLAGVGSGAVQRELAKLEGAGLLTAERMGRQKHYQANAASPVFTELRGLVLKTSGLADVLRAALAPLAGDVRAAFVFGSVATGGDTARSDVDLMVVSDALAYPELFTALEPAAATLGRTVNPTVYTPDELRHRVAHANAFVSRVLAGPKIWIVGDDRALAAR
jgi:predicted nucleotidyltransferase